MGKRNNITRSIMHCIALFYIYYFHIAKSSTLMFLKVGRGTCPFVPAFFLFLFICFFNIFDEIGSQSKDGWWNWFCLFFFFFFSFHNLLLNHNFNLRFGISPLIDLIFTLLRIIFFFPAGLSFFHIYFYRGKS